MVKKQILNFDKERSDKVNHNICILQRVYFNIKTETFERGMNQFYRNYSFKLAII